MSILFINIFDRVHINLPPVMEITAVIEVATVWLGIVLLMNIASLLNPVLSEARDNRSRERENRDIDVVAARDRDSGHLIIHNGNESSETSIEVICNASTKVKVQGYTLTSGRFVQGVRTNNSSGSFVTLGASKTIVDYLEHLDANIRVTASGQAPTWVQRAGNKSRMVVPLPPILP